MEKLILQTLIIVLIMVTWIGGGMAVTYDNLKKQGNVLNKKLFNKVKMFFLVIVILFIVISLIVWL